MPDGSRDAVSSARLGLGRVSETRRPRAGGPRPAADACMRWPAGCVLLATTISANVSTAISISTSTPAATAVSSAMADASAHSVPSEAVTPPLPDAQPQLQPTAAPGAFPSPPAHPSLLPAANAASATPSVPASPAASASVPVPVPALTPAAVPAHVPASPSPARRKLSGYVGFANLPNQVHRKSVRKGFTFTCMVVGESGLGKSTLVNTLFSTGLYPSKSVPPPGAEQPSTVSIESTSADIDENGVRLRLTVVDTPGFGDNVNNDSAWAPIVANIESRFGAYLEQENRVNRRNLVDNRVSACLYFIQPTGHSLRPIDLEFMRHLHDKVNLIPVISKSDTLTDEEILAFKQRILADLDHHQIQIFHAPVYDNDDEETYAENAEIAVRSFVPCLLTRPQGDRMVHGPN